jgi:hypothetical protein
LKNHQKQPLGVDIDVDHTWRGIYSIARSNYGTLSNEAEVALHITIGPVLQLTTAQFRNCVLKVLIRLFLTWLLQCAQSHSLCAHCALFFQVLASKMESAGVATGSACMQAVCSAGPCKCTSHVSS